MGKILVLLRHVFLIYSIARFLVTTAVSAARRLYVQNSVCLVFTGAEHR